MYSNIPHIICAGYDHIINREYEQMFEGLRDAIYDTKDDVQKIAEHIAANLTGEIPGIGTFGIPLNPLQTNYSRVKFWPQSAWQEIKNGAKVNAVDAPVLTLFFEDEFGERVSPGIGEEVRGDLTAYWIDMLKDGELPLHYSGLGLKRREDFRKTMEDKYPWLRLCEGHWKVRQIWVNYYRKGRILAIINNDPTLKEKFAAVADAQYIEISSDTEDAQPAQKKKAVKKAVIKKTVVTPPPDTEDRLHAPRNTTDKASVVPSNPTTGSELTESSDSSTGSKRRRQDMDDPGPTTPTKKHKGKAPVTSNFHPPRPQPRMKAPGKVGKVSCGPLYLSEPC